jgi:hypothetical protein
MVCAASGALPARFVARSFALAAMRNKRFS